jgi:hypothetical protein
MAGDGRLSLSSALWRNTDETLPRSTRSSVTSASAPSPELPGHEGEQSSEVGNGAAVIDGGYAVPDSHRPMQGWRPPTAGPRGGDGSCGSEGGRPPGTQSAPKKRENWDLRPAVMLLRQALRVKGFVRLAQRGRGLKCLTASPPSRPRVPWPAGGARLLSCRPGP